jgi:hypothetical protein
VASGQDGPQANHMSSFFKTDNLICFGLLVGFNRPETTVMSGKPQYQRPSKDKHEYKQSDNMPTTDAALVTAKHQSKEAAPTMSVAATTINVPDAILKVYQHMLPNNPEGIAFLFDSAFSKAFQAPAERVATRYRVTKEEAIEEFRRLLVIKAFTVDKEANKISPTPLST